MKPQHQRSQYPAAERRQLTVVRCDLANSTALQERIGAEQYWIVERAFLDHCTRVAERCDAEHVRYTGDGYAFAYGRLQASENDAERAIRFSLDLAASTAELRPMQIPISIRVSVATGDAIVQLPSTDSTDSERPEAMLTGRVLNLAARLIGRAEPGEVVVGDLTRRLTGGLFAYRDMGEADFKGFSIPEHCWLVLGATNLESRFESLPITELTSLVGRDTECNELMKLWRDVRNGYGRAALLRGDPGLGKSRLTRWILEQVADPYSQRVCLDCQPHHGERAASALEPVRRYLISAAGFSEDDLEEDKRRKLTALLTGTVSNPEECTNLFNTLVINSESLAAATSSPDALRTRRLSAIIEHFMGLARFGPLVIVFEDAHWADAGTLTLMELLAPAVENSSTLMIVTMRYEESRNGELARIIARTYESFTFTDIVLKPLADDASESIVRAVLAADPQDDAIIQEIVERADGVPLFIENICHEATLVETTSEVRLSNVPLAPTPHSVPKVLWETLMSRLDRLTGQKRYAQIAAVLGRDFSVELLAVVAGQPIDEVVRALSILEEARILISSETANRRFQFRHALVRDVAYFSLLDSDCGALHKRVGQALLGSSVDIAVSKPEILAQHFELSADLELDAAAQMIGYLDAASYWYQAAKTSANRSEIAECLTRLDHATELVHLVSSQDYRNQADAIELLLWTERAYVESLYHGWSAHEVGDALDQGYAVCKRLGNPGGIFNLYAISVGHLLTLGDLDRAGDLGAQCLKLAKSRTNPKPRHILIGLRALTGHAFLAGDHHKALGYANEALALYDAHEQTIREEDRRVVMDHKVVLLVYRGLALLSLGCVDQAVDSSLLAVRHAEQLQHGNSTAFAKSLLAATRYHRCDAFAIDVARESLKFANEHNLATFIGVSQIILGGVLVDQGDIENGLKQVSEGVAAHSGIEADAYQPFGMAVVTSAQLAVGKPTEGLMYLQAAMDVMKKTGEIWYRPEVRRLRGECLAMQAAQEGREVPPEAIEELRLAIAEAQRQDARFFQLRAVVSLAKLLGKTSEQTAALDNLAPLIEWFTEGTELPGMVEARKIIDTLQN